ncbi:hypothetical protein ABC795_06560 [Blastococcus sp. HT6-30]|uniref:hypothetical protein n=1 Tax=Blastococcus sp. HT6-30 TaxID=3144843 RepID=UPI00321BA8ED
MRTSHAATAIAAFTAGLTAAAALRRRAGQRENAITAAAPGIPPAARAPGHDAVVLPFARPVLAGPVPTQPRSPARCGESGGRTKAGAPCGARTTTGGRCHHHPIAA